VNGLAAGDCPEPACADGESYCDGTYEQVCHAGRTEFVRAGGCACAEGETYGDGAALHLCNSSQTEFTTSECASPAVCEALQAAGTCDVAESAWAEGLAMVYRFRDCEVDTHARSMVRAGRGRRRPMRAKHQARPDKKATADQTEGGASDPLCGILRRRRLLHSRFPVALAAE
jgi:hypothetical protein